MGKLGIVAGILGILVWALAFFGRFHGAPTIYGFAASTVFSGGTALVVLGCFLRLLKK